ncbi:hypothetical protein PV11_06476 [Exophiala sideris]|uniref:Uncharacterized protein n=1 Tax=Exophiala sideris TaxID=1016849 RepID=A0A0D1YDJ8_9EURO|nr:hypothetical protein PV11_06476 [Exophiala sideris]
MCSPWFVVWLFFATVIDAAIFPISALSPLCNATDIVTETVFVTASLVTPPAVTVTVTASSVVSSVFFSPLPTVSPLAPGANSTTTVTEIVGNSSNGSIPVTGSTTVTLFSTTRLTMTTGKKNPPKQNITMKTDRSAVIPPFANTSATAVTNTSVNSTTTVMTTQMITSTLVLANMSSTTTESVDTIVPQLTPASVPDSVVLTFPPLPTISAPGLNVTATGSFAQTATVTETSTALVTLTATTDAPGPVVPVPATTPMSESSLDQNMTTTTTSTLISTRSISLVVFTSGTTTVFPTASSVLPTGSVNGTTSNTTTFHASTQTPTFGFPSTASPSLSLTPVQTGSASSLRIPYIARLVVLIGRMLSARADDFPIAVSAPDSGLINVTVAGPTPVPMSIPMSIPIISTSTFYNNCTTTSTTDLSRDSVSIPLSFKTLSISSSTTVTDTLTAQTTIETTVIIDNTTATFNVPVIPPQLTAPASASIFNLTAPITAPGIVTGPSTGTNSSTTPPFNVLTFLTGTGANNATTTAAPPSVPFPWMNTSSGVDAHNSLLDTSEATSYPPKPTASRLGSAGTAMPLPPKSLVYGTVTCLLLIGAGAWVVL